MYYAGRENSLSDKKLKTSSLSFALLTKGWVATSKAGIIRGKRESNNGMGKERDENEKKCIKKQEKCCAFDKFNLGTAYTKTKFTYFSLKGITT